MFPMKSAVLKRCLWLVAWVTLVFPVCAQPEPLSPPAPFFPRTSVAVGPGISRELDAKRALQLGLPTIAITLYRPILEDPETPATVRNRVVLDLATALLEEERFNEAAEVLGKFTGPAVPALRLRQAMIAMRERRFDVARIELQGIDPEQLVSGEHPGDRGWYFFLRGQLAEESRDSQANSFYQQAYQAASAAGLETQRAWFMLARQRLTLRSGSVSERDLAAWRKIVENSPASAQAYSATSQLAVGLASMGQSREAITVLRNGLDHLPRHERDVHDEWQLLLGLIAGAEEGVGRTALKNLLIQSSDQDRQRIALRLLARVSTTGQRRDDFRALLDQLIGTSSPHPILEYLLLVRAQTALTETVRRYEQAESDANRLLTEFPNSPLKATALGVLMESAWAQGYYRLAATQASKARAELPAGETRAQLGVLVAEAYFRAAQIGRSALDYRTAADAYGAALAEVPAGIAPGDLMFQRVLALINSGELDAAETTLDELARDPRLDVTNRWQAEWNLARALQVADAAPQAYARLNSLLGNRLTAAGLPPDLRASMAWLQARLALQNDDPVRTFELADALLATLDDVTPALRREIASNTLLLQARAGFALKGDQARNRAAGERLQKLRADYPDSDAAVFSYIIEADAADAEGRVLDAQRLVRDLADKFPKSIHAPYALFQAALYAERRGPQYHNDAYKTLEELVTNYPEDSLVFYARLKQGNLLRQMNEYGRARTLYADMVNRFKFPQFADALSADIALADTEATLAATDPSRAGNAAAIYERLYDLQSAPIDLRVEAGHKLGYHRAERENAARAYAVWWPLIEAFVRDDVNAARLGYKGRFWSSRTILLLGELLERQGKPREARQLYELLLEKGLPGVSQARDGLARTGGLPPSS